MGKVRQTADSASAAGETSSRQNSYRSFGPLYLVYSPIISFTPIPFLFFCEINFVSQDRQVLDVEDGDDGGHEGVAGGNRESPK